VAGAKPKKCEDLNKIRSYLAGQERLWKAYWLIYTLGSIVVTLVTVVALIVLEQLGFPIGIWQLLIVILVSYLLWWLLSSFVVWRCAPNTDWVGWTYLARAVVLLYFVLAIASVFEGVPQRLLG